MEINVLIGNIVQQPSELAAVVVLEDAALPAEIANLSNQLHNCERDAK